jgi:putative heme-binding domain-containing protein
MFSIRSPYPVGLFLILTLSQVCFSQAGRDSSVSPKTAPAAGRNTFNSECAACHGLDGHGSDKAVDISTNPRVQHLSEVQLANIISNGIPETGMPAFPNLTENQVREVVSYLRSLQGKGEVRTLPGDVKRGKEIFFGRGDCSSCHSVSGQGGFLGPDLTNHAAASSANAIRDEIVKAPRTPLPGYRMAMVTTTSGNRLEGIVRNEDNFTVQLQTKDGSFHLLKKTELQSFQYSDSSLMPADYRNRLSDRELNDLASYLMSTPDASKGTTSRKKRDEAE